MSKMHFGVLHKICNLLCFKIINYRNDEQIYHQSKDLMQEKKQRKFMTCHAQDNAKDIQNSKTYELLFQT